MEVFLWVAMGFAVPARTVVVIFFASYMAVGGGMAVFVERLVQAYSALLGAFGRGFRVLDGNSILLDGTNSTRAIRSIAEVEHCLRHLMCDIRTSWPLGPFSVN